MDPGSRETAGTTICLIVRYVRHHAGADGVSRLLDLAGETRPLAELEDQDRWSTYEQKIALFDAACMVLDDPDAVLHIGEAALDHQVGAGIRILIRALGSPGLVLANVAKACPKFSTVATMTAEEVDHTRTTSIYRVSYRLDDEKTPHRGDCQLNIGLMRTIGPIFGLPPLDVEHTACQVEGAPKCEYTVSWARRRFGAKRAQLRARVHEVDALTAQLAMLQSTTEDLVSSDDVDAVLGRIVSRAGRAVSAPRYLLALYEHETISTSVHAVGIDAAELDAVAAAVLAAPLGIDDHQIVIEVASDRHTYGRLAAFYEGHQFFEHEAALLGAYARSAAVALDAATALESARRRGAVTEALLGLARSLAEPSNPARVARIVASAMPEILGVDASAVLLWNAETETLRVAGRCGWAQTVSELIGHFEINVAASPGLQDYLYAPAPTIMRLDKSDPGPVARMLEPLGFPALAVVPLRAHPGGLFGLAIASVAATDEVRSAAIVERLAAIADQAATAIQNATLIEQMRHQAVHDALTGLANRALADEELEKAVARSTRDQSPLSLLFIDLDDFKAVNDRFGHGAGDHVLRTISRRLVDAARLGDSVARRGGDEFTMMLPGATRAEAFAVAERLGAVLSQPISLGEELVCVHASIGIATAPFEGVTGDAIVRAADTAMYRAKENTRVMCSVSHHAGA